MRKITLYLAHMMSVMGQMQHILFTLEGVAIVSSSICLVILVITKSHAWCLLGGAG